MLSLISKYLPSGHSKKIYMCYIHYYNRDCFFFFSCSNSNSFKVGRVRSVCFVASGCLHHLCHHGSVVYLHQSSGNWSSVWSGWKKEEARNRICRNRFRLTDVTDKDVNVRKPVEDELGPEYALTCVSRWRDAVGWPLMGTMSALWTKPRKQFSKQPSMNLKLWKKPFFFFLREILFKVHIHIFTALWAFPAFNSFPVTQMKLFGTNLIVGKSDQVPYGLHSNTIWKQC